MTKGRWPVAAIADLESVYEAWPGTEYSKSLLRALVLRVQIEQTVAALPLTVVVEPDTNSVSRRLMLSLGGTGGSAKASRIDACVWFARASARTRRSVMCCTGVIRIGTSREATLIFGQRQ